MSRYFLSCDWGTSRFRLRLVDRENLAVAAEFETSEGASSFCGETCPDARAKAYEAALIRHAADLFSRTGLAATHCVISGMASSGIGWFDLPYAKLPLPLDAARLTRKEFDVRLPEGNLRAILVSGMCSSDDIMRGEECELLGLANLVPEIASGKATLILPGTHSKHIRIEGGIVTGFCTYMTGELFAHLREMPTLKDSLAPGGGFSETCFENGARASLEMGLSAALFKIRSSSILSGAGAIDGASFLSGALIGYEMAERARTDGQIFLAASPSMSPRYLAAAKVAGISLRGVPPEFLKKAVLNAHRSFLGEKYDSAHQLLGGCRNR